MTCREATELMECIFDGDLDEDSEEGLHEHLGDCAACADSWHAYRRVRVALVDSEIFDPGEAYFEEATASIMERVTALAASQTSPPEDAPVVGSSMRYGPLGVRGVGLAFVLVLTFFLDALASSPAPACVPASTGYPTDIRDALQAVSPQQTDGFLGALFAADHTARLRSGKAHAPKLTDLDKGKPSPQPALHMPNVRPSDSPPPLPMAA